MTPTPLELHQADANAIATLIGRATWGLGAWATPGSQVGTGLSCSSGQVDAGLFVETTTSPDPQDLTKVAMTGQLQVMLNACVTDQTGTIDGLTLDGFLDGNGTYDVPADPSQPTGNAVARFGGSLSWSSFSDAATGETCYAELVTYGDIDLAGTICGFDVTWDGGPIPSP